MKKIFLFLCLAATAFCADAQTIDTTYKYAVACKISPFKANFTDTLNVTYLNVSDLYDNLSDSCTFFYQLLDIKGVAHMSGTYNCSGASYKAWDGNNLFPFRYVANKLNLNFQ
jgi:hypothetical protein